jgi:uncharacterized iron-regulated protein
MRRVALLFFGITALAVWLASPSFSGAPRDLLRIADGATVTLTEILHDLKNASLVFVGERHDQKEHHELQLTVIRGLNEAGVPVAVGLEMFRAESQMDLDRWVQGEISEGEFKHVYDNNWTSSWNLYKDIFLYARTHRIPMIGLNVPREITRQVAQGGFRSLTPDQMGELPDVSCDVDSTYMAFIRRSFDQHPHGESEFAHFCEAQIVWDTAMAWHLLRFLEANPEHTVVVLAGNGHAWKRGIAAQIRRWSRITYRVILPEEPERLERGSVSKDDLDYLWLKR